MDDAALSDLAFVQVFGGIAYHGAAVGVADKDDVLTLLDERVEHGTHRGDIVVKGEVLADRGKLHGLAGKAGLVEALNYVGPCFWTVLVGWIVSLATCKVGLLDSPRHRGQGRKWVSRPWLPRSDLRSLGHGGCVKRAAWFSKHFNLSGSCFEHCMAPEYDGGLAVSSSVSSAALIGRGWPGFPNFSTWQAVWSSAYGAY